jgi:hypothetical protein
MITGSGLDASSSSTTGEISVPAIFSSWRRPRSRRSRARVVEDRAQRRLARPRAVVGRAFASTAFTRARSASGTSPAGGEHGDLRPLGPGEIDQAARRARVGAAVAGQHTRESRTSRLPPSWRSRASRACSSAEPCQPRSTRRSSGGAIIDVTTASSTTSAYEAGFSTPSERPTVATTISTAPRALRPMPSASPSRAGSAAKPRAEIGAARLRDARDRHDARAPAEHLGIAQQAEVDAQARVGEEERREERARDGRRAVDDVGVVEARAPSTMPRDERAEHRLEPSAWWSRPRPSATSSIAVMCACAPQPRTRTKRSSASTARWPTVNASPRKITSPRS